jgi:hypothetical protein
LLVKYREGKLVVRDAARTLGVDHSNLRKYLKRGFLPKDVPGPACVLGSVAEARIAYWLKEAAAIGLPITLGGLKRIAQCVAQKMGIDLTTFAASRDWTERFFARHGELAKLKPTKTNRGRLTNFNRITYANWCAVAKPIIKQYDPKEVFNADDTHVNPEVIMPAKVRHYTPE